MGVNLELVDDCLTEYDLNHLADAIDPARDNQFTYLGLQTLDDRYFIHYKGKRLERPQVFFMRVAMGLEPNEYDPFKLLSDHHSGRHHPGVEQ